FQARRRAKLDASERATSRARRWPRGPPRRIPYTAGLPETETCVAKIRMPRRRSAPVRLCARRDSLPPGSSAPAETRPAARAPATIPPESSAARTSARHVTRLLLDPHDFLDVGIAAHVFADLRRRERI